MMGETYNRIVLRAEGLVPPLSQWYFATARQRMQPSFFVIGVQKGGTTALTQYLTQHPKVIQPQRKDIYFFNNTENFAQGRHWYQAHFAHRLYKRWCEISRNVRDAVTFDGTPNYFAAPGAAERLHSYFPDTKLILLLRHPAERAWSNYRMNKRHGFEPLSFEDALAAETERLAAEDAFAAKNGTHSYVRQRLAYRTNGIYVEFLREWLKYFDRSQLLITTTEEMQRDTQSVYNAVTDFAGLPRFAGVHFARYNEGGEKETMAAKTREELNTFFAPHNRALEEMLGRSFDWQH
ncbi:MAG: sulfotransferase family protein [Bacteroidia bacterium]